MNTNTYPCGARGLIVALGLVVRMCGWCGWFTAAASQPAFRNGAQEHRGHFFCYRPLRRLSTVCLQPNI